MLSFKYIDNCPPYSIELERGAYIVEGWGASGGSNSETSRGKGAYAKAKLQLPTKTSFLITIGGAGQAGTVQSPQRFKGGCNGGGDGGIGYGNYSNGSGGGGATDIRINNSYTSRIFVVAGGGGDCGKGINDDFTLSGGYGGGPNGGIADHFDNFSQQANSETTLINGIKDGKGQIGRDGISGSSSGEGNGGGGGGYLGGYSSQTQGDATNAGGNGGSSFVSSTYFSSIVYKAGNVIIDSPDGHQETGHNGNGYLKIYLSKPPTCRSKTIYHFSYFFYITSLLLMK